MSLTLHINKTILVQGGEGDCKGEENKVSRHLTSFDYVLETWRCSPTASLLVIVPFRNQVTQGGPRSLCSLPSCPQAITNLLPVAVD